VTILATSREALGLAGEHIRRVPPLSVPEITPLPSLNNLWQYEAVQLFVDRARRALPEFTLTAQNSAAVVQVCRRLDGLPLALELAAAQVRLLRVEEIAARLEDHFSLLQGGSRSSLPRHKTLQACMAWSFDLLSAAEHRLLARLSVFAGGWTLAAAEAVGAVEGGTDLLPNGVLGLLTGLVSKSLVTAHRTPGLATRYGMLETIRAFAGQRLVEAGEEAAVRRKQASHLLAVATSAGIRMTVSDDWLESLVPEFDNVRNTLDWALDQAPDLAVRLVEALGPYWFHANGVRLGRRYVRQALAWAETIGDPGLRAALLNHDAALAWQQGDYDTVRSLCTAFLAQWREADDKSLKAWHLFGLGMALAAIEGPRAAAASARLYLEEAIMIARALGEKASLASYLWHLGSVLSAGGDDTAARELHEESAAMLRDLQHKYALSAPLGYLAHIHLRRGEYSEARALFIESLRLHQGWHLWGLAWRLEGFAGLAAMAEEPHRAARLYGAAEAMLERVGAKFHWIDRLGYERYVATARAQLGHDAFNTAWAEGRALTSEQAVAYALAEQLT
jgi:non-specific serine/threonine protein kinase